MGETENRGTAGKPRYKNSNFRKVVNYLLENFPEKTVGDFCDRFGYTDHIKGLLTMEEPDFKEKFPDDYSNIQEKYDKTRKDFRSAFETARDICSNFIMEDLLADSINKSFSSVKVRTNEDEKRDIEAKATNKPDFVFTNLDTGKEIMFDLKIDWFGKVIKKKKFFFRGHEDSDYRKYGAVALIWCPVKNRFTFVDFRKDVKGERGTDESKGGKEGFWADLEKNTFGEIYFGDNVFLDHMIQQLDRFSRK